MNASLELRQILNRIGSRFRQLRLWSGLAICWILFAIVGIILSRLLLPAEAYSGRLLAVILGGLAALAGIVWYLIIQRTARDPHWIAQKIESKHPDLSALLLTAVEQESSPNRSLGFLQASVLASALKHNHLNHWEEVVPRRGLQISRYVQFASLAGLIVTLVVMSLHGLPPASAGPVGKETVEEMMAKLQVDPGHTEVERGNPLLITARFGGQVPSEASLVIESAAGVTVRPMFRGLDDPLFSGHIPAVDADLSYRIEFNGGRSDNFRVKVFEHPELKKVNARLEFPKYTGLESKTVEDVRRITAVEGTAITLFCQLTKPVTEAKLIDEKKEGVALSLHDAEKHIYTVTLTPPASQRYHLSLTDAEGRNNKLPSDITINITPNQPPTIKVTRPGRDTRVSPLEELPLKADMKDDFGLIRYGLSIVAPDQTAKEIVLHEADPKQFLKKAQPDYLLDLESLRAQPDQVVSYYFWAEDIGPDGKPRRASGDLYFAEVRHFEEIFRQGEQQTREQREQQEREQQEQGGDNAQQADQLAEMQKQIINATWKLIRRETIPTPSSKFAEDTKLIRESQQKVQEMAEQFAEKLQGSPSGKDLAEAMRLMKQAEEQLATAEKGAPPQLPPALASEQAAYQALLKLRAREFEVSRNNSRQQQQRSQQSRNSRSPSQQQLQQLDLTQEENRYETQSAARAQKEQQAQRDREQRENQELSDRLKELARRQTDVTDRVKELQSALEQAKDPKQKEELQQQLKRLRDQQQQLLRDTEDLQERMEKPENQERMADARQQVEQSREQQRQAAESLEKGQLSQAVNEGTRAGRQLENLRDQLRKESANKFGEEMRDLRQEARQLDEKQQKLTEQLQEMKRDEKPTLRDSSEKAEVQKGLEEQKKKFDQLSERIQKTVLDAEKPEPLLAQELFNTARQAAEKKTGESMDLARQLAGAGGIPDAAEASRKAAEGTEQLRKGIEKAADNVLGGQTEALKRAQRELDDLAEQLNREIAQATGQPNREGQGRENPQPKDGQQQGGQQQGREGQPQAGQQGREGRPERKGEGQQEREGQPGQGGQQGRPERKGEGQQEREGQPGQGGQQGRPERKGESQQGQQREGEQPGQGGQQGRPERKGEGQQGQQREGEQPGQGGQQGRPERKGEGQQGQQREGQQGQPQEREGQQGQQPGQGQQQGREGQQPQPGQQRGQQTPRSLTDSAGVGGGNREQAGNRQARQYTEGSGPIREEGFREWTERLRSTEDLLEDPQLRAEAAQIRDRVRTAREEFKRHSKEPDWKKMQNSVLNPLNELQKKVAEEIRRRESPDALVPIDRDPVPPQFTDGVRRYYERLGSNKR